MSDTKQTDEVQRVDLEELTDEALKLVVVHAQTDPLTARWLLSRLDPGQFPERG